ncbi:uncharacterized protein SPPG_02179 [Spizellomyces punctatus DAOM BR117]|uniref:C2H2-type domain-containing protein n=2 Tax=Spizellomyces punctatus (strain DAOM BR117) TaxID=645134 RepID=A0A0L0HQN8_SPIPD|nr:hypothetical protein, variant [Spizellomyces punctatus DAOM BR117]XP_016611158.1 uncharacterized protein SPPG_02179 [Spizellomyces punctatus DAOM BR117]KND03118.1 hypothetical protein, variant [Spizellomyces punctatus DAOM BR117]KND03119.1 hypothetical protein SPPG_02179 [Spizellomyces punctatus DAOM BR117]|eukprot:XP_016611157.1 hypothetical protein, variant [Spizellomyces punctatus DAOM BR117]
MPAIDVSMPIAMACSPATPGGDTAAYRRRFSIIGSLGKSLGTSLGRSFTGSFGRNSYTREGFLDVYNFQFGARSPVVAASPAHELAHFAGLEDRFCKDFFCCGMNLGNLHDLLQHFEECHVRVESDVDEDEDLPFEFESMDEMDTDMSDGDSVSSHPTTFSDIYLKSQLLQSQTNPTQAVALSDIFSEDYRISNRSGSTASAFDTSVIRKRVTSGPTSTRVKKVKPAQQPEQQPTLPFSVDGPTQMVSDMDIDEPPVAPSPSVVQTPSPAPTPAPAAAPSPSPAPVSMPQSLCPPSLPAALNLQPLHLPTAASLALPNFDTPVIAPAAAGQTPMSYDAMAMVTDDSQKDDRPYKCKVMGCTKAYKNPGGLKYHMQHGHCEDTGDPEMNNIIHKPYQCTVPDCGKRYKNLNGLKYHIEHAHISLLGAC